MSNSEDLSQPFDQAAGDHEILWNEVRAVLEPARDQNNQQAHEAFRNIMEPIAGRIYRTVYRSFSEEEHGERYEQLRIAELRQLQEALLQVSLPEDGPVYLREIDLAEQGWEDSYRKGLSLSIEAFDECDYVISVFQRHDGKIQHGDENFMPNPLTPKTESWIGNWLHSVASKLDQRIHANSATTRPTFITADTIGRAEEVFRKTSLYEMFRDPEQVWEEIFQRIPQVAEVFENGTSDAPGQDPEIS